MKLFSSDTIKIDRFVPFSFASGEHGNCPSFNDGQGGVYAHATYPQYGGGVHFDESEIWTLNSDKGSKISIIFLSLRSSFDT